MEDGQDNVSALTEDQDSAVASSEIHLVSRVAQIIIIIIIILVSVLANLLIMTTICWCDIKSKIVSYQLVNCLCFVDLLGAVTILPVPLAVTIQGQWSLTDNMCFVNSFLTLLIWMEHMIMFALLKVDKVLVSVLPARKYPVMSVFWTRVLVLLTWLLSALVSFVINTVYRVEYEPAVLLCIPTLPQPFFLTAMAVLATIIVAVIIGFLGTLLHLKKTKTRIRDGTASNQNRRNHKDLEKSLCSNFMLTMFHIVLYIPTVLVVGLHGWLLSPLLIVVCDMFVYSEFLIHPIVLFVSSDSLRQDIWLNLLSNYQALMKAVSGLCVCCSPIIIREEPRLERSGKDDGGSIQIIQLRSDLLAERKTTQDKATMTSPVSSNTACQ